MLLRVVFFVLMAFGLIGFGTVAWIATRPPPAAAVAAAAAPQPLPQKAVVAATHPLRAGALLKPEDVAIRSLPLTDSTNVLPDGPDALRTLAGSMIRRDVDANEPIRAADIMKPSDHGFLAAVLQPGMRAVTIGVDATSGAGGMIWPGDRVDLILTQAMSEAALPPGRRVAAETVLIDTRVIAIDQPGPNGQPTGETRTVTLEVTQAAAERVSVAMRLGRLSLSVRASSGAASGTQVPGQPGAPATGSNTTWARDVSPALGNDKPPPSDNVVRVFQGSGDVREFKY